MVPAVENILWASYFEGWDVYFVSGWQSTGHMLAQASVGILLFSPVLEKVRAFVIVPGLKNYDKQVARLNAERAPFLALGAKKKSQYETICKIVNAQRKNLLRNSERVMTDNYALCLIGLLINVACMTLMLDYLFGPGCLLMAWPLMWLYLRLWDKARRSAKDAEMLVDSLIQLKNENCSYDITGKSDTAVSELLQVLREAKERNWKGGKNHTRRR